MNLLKFSQLREFPSKREGSRDEDKDSFSFLVRVRYLNFSIILKGIHSKKTFKILND